MRSLVATFRYVLITAIRDRFLGAILLAQVAVTGGGRLLAASALAEGKAMGLAIGGEAMRGVTVLGLITFISFHVRRMDESREIEAILARPIARSSFVLAYFAAYAGIAALTVAFTVPLLMGGFGASGAGFVQWEVSLLLESLIVAALALFAAISLESATASVLAGVGLYLLGRSAAYFRAIADSNTGMLGSDNTNKAVRWVIEGVAAAVPRLDLFGQGGWLVYGPSGGWGLGELATQTVVILAVLLLATIRDLSIKRY